MVPIVASRLQDVTGDDGAHEQNFQHFRQRDKTALGDGDWESKLNYVKQKSLIYSSPQYGRRISRQIRRITKNKDIDFRIRHSKNSFIWPIPESVVNGRCLLLTGDKPFNNSQSDSVTVFLSCRYDRDRKNSIIFTERFRDFE